MVFFKTSVIKEVRWSLPDEPLYVIPDAGTWHLFGHQVVTENLLCASTVLAAGGNQATVPSLLQSPRKEGTNAGV